jgi:hypothetical protein
VERERAESLERRLDEYFERSADTLVRNPDQGLDFVHHPDRYTYFWNSNHQVAGWLRELGCEVRGPSFNSIWDVRRTQAGGP